MLNNCIDELRKQLGTDETNEALLIVKAIEAVRSRNEKGKYIQKMSEQVEKLVISNNAMKSAMLEIVLKYPITLEVLTKHKLKPENGSIKLLQTEQ